MKKWPGPSTKRFSFRLFVAFASVTVAVSALLLWGIYFSAREDLMESERNLSTELLTQVRYNLNTLDEMNRTLCLTALNSNEAQSLLYNTQSDSYQLMLLRNRLADSLKSNPFVHSVYLHNRALDTFYSTYKSFHYVDDDFLEKLESGTLTPNLKPVVRAFDGSVVLTYGLGELYGSAVDGVAIYLNVYLDYLMDNLEVFTDSQLLAFDRDGNLINRFANRADVPDEFIEALVREMPERASGERADMMTLRVSSLPLMSATMLYCPQMEWTLVKLTPYNEVFSRTERLRVTIIVVSVFAFTMIIALCYLVSRRMYRPIQHMIRQVSDDEPNAIIEDEFAYLSRFYLEMRSELSELKRTRQNRMLQADLAFQKLLLQSHLMSRTEISELIEEYGLNLDANRPMRLIMFIADDYAQLPSEFAQESERTLLLFGLRNLLEEAFSLFESFALSCPEDHYLALLVNSEEEAALTDGVKTYQRSVLAYFNLPVAVAVSDRIDEAERIADAYAKARALLDERFIHGKDFILRVGEAGTQPPASGADTSELLERLRAFIEEGDADSASREANAFFDLLFQMDAAGALTQIIRLQMTFNSALYKLNVRRLEPIDFSELMRDVASIKSRTLQEYRTQVLQAIDEMKRDGPEKTRIDSLAGNIRGIIEREYADPMLCASSIADELSMSSAHAGRVFRQHTGLTIPEYVNQVRLTKAALWLANSDLTVGDIMLRVGYTNESYFFKLFKARYGVTPRNYHS